ncbi:regulator of G-protein signaling 12 [Python bivittatus]|uniref:Regulator of G-protein signaling 12 n=1 Tax=Python bivittatus TaxID=176946 RepID=A0A9F5IJ46_PYTBI|nr:regulator of G-protein signaling 12 [Python bivittatus]
MYRPGEKVKRRLRVHGCSVRNVEVARGRAGYGFTLSGQAPCVLSSVLKGSPADYVGLKAGDKIFAINEINVKRASHEDVVKLIGKCSGILHMVIAEGVGHAEPCSSDEEVGLYDGKGWPKTKPGLKGLGINRAEKVVEEMQSGEIFNMIFENSNICASNMQIPKRKETSVQEVAKLEPEHINDQPNILYNEELAQGLNDDSVFRIGLENQEYFGIDASILNVAMVVGYLGSIELPSSSSNLEYDSLQAIRGCMRRLRAEQRIHSLVAMKIMHDSIQLCTNQSVMIAKYPAEKLAFSALCPDDRRFFGLVTMQSIDDASLAQEDEAVLRTSCHVFMVDPELFNHKIHQGIARRFGLECTADPDTNGCLEFPLSSLPVLQFVSVLYRDMGEFIEGVRARAFLDGEADPHQNNSMSSNSDSGIGNINQEEKSRVLVVDLGTNSNKHMLSNIQGSPINRGQSVSHWNFGHEPEENLGLEPMFQNDKSQNLSKLLASSAHIEVPVVSSKSSVPPCKKNSVDISNQRWLPVHVLKDWQQGCISDQESYTDSTDGWSSVNCGTLPPPMNKIPADRYKVSSSFGNPHLMSQKKELSEKEFHIENAFDSQHSFKKPKEEKKSAKFGPGFGLVQLLQHSSSARRSFGRSKRFSVTRSLDNLESTTVSDGELNHSDLKDGASDTSLSSNASLPSVQSCQRHRERRVASWAVSFERLLQDPLGIRYFSEFLRKEFSEENILFWQACEYFNHIPAHDKKELSFRAQEIFNKYLCSKATTPVNIDSQVQLADDVLTAPHPNMFRDQQLQIFNLMKFDSYTRFLKSPFYQECVLAEVEGRPVPDPQCVTSSPTSKSSFGPDMFSVSTPRKLGGKAKSGRSLNEESGEEDAEKKKKGAFFSWSRSKSLGRSQKKKENGDCLKDSSQTSGLSYRHKSQDSLSSAASLEMGESYRVSGPTMEKEKPSKCCHVNLPDGSTFAMPIRGGFSIKDVLSEFCEKQGINMAAVDLFLIGGDKPLVLHQDSRILDSRTLRLEKRTLFRLDLIPINRSVGLKAKPTKPVTEVLHPVVAKYGLNLNNLVARLNGEQEPLDLGAPISSLDGQRVILEDRTSRKGKDKGKGASLKHSAPVTTNAGNQALTGEGRTAGRHNSFKSKGETGKNSRDAFLAKREDSLAQAGKKMHQQLNLEEAEEFFELISKVQSNRADDQRGLLRKEDLVLPDFLHLPSYETGMSSSVPEGATGSCERTSPPDGQEKRREKGSRPHNPSHQAARRRSLPESKERPLALSAALSQEASGGASGTAPRPPALLLQESPKWKGEGEAVEEENVADLTLVAEGDINSPNSRLIPSERSGPMDAKDSPPATLAEEWGKGSCEKFKPGVLHRQKAHVQGSDGSLYEPTPPNRSKTIDFNPAGIRKETFRPELPISCIIDVDNVTAAHGLEWSCHEPEDNLHVEGCISEPRGGQLKMQARVQRTPNFPTITAVGSEKNKENESHCKATFV